ncbi:MAG TPA: thioredoxin family protein [Thermomicrobiaceae bacterium]|nr:thioredoxin family protein [Thermomicrobiaceae bacterium]
MPIIPEEDQQYLRDLFAERLDQDVTVNLYTQRETGLIVPGHECATCRETHQLMDELVALSDKLKLEVHDFYADADKAREQGINEIPAVVLQGQNKGNLRFIGAPAGYEFATLIEDLVDVSRGQTELDQATQQMLADLKEPVHIQVFVTPT